MFGLCQKSSSWRARKLKRLILLSGLCKIAGNFPAHPCTSHTQRGLRSQSWDSRLNCILTQCMFGLPRLVSENRLCEPNSIETSSKRESLERWCSEQTARKSSINCQSKASLQSSAIESKHNHLNFGAPQFPGTACTQSSFLCPPWDLRLTTHSYHCSILLSTPTFILSQHCYCEIHNECVI